MSILTLAGSPSSRSRSSALLRHAAERLSQRGQVIREAGHAASEPGITDALVRATGEMARRLLDLPPEEA